MLGRALEISPVLIKTEAHKVVLSYIFLAFVFAAIFEMHVSMLSLSVL